MQAWTRPESAAANPYGGGHLTAEERAFRLEELRLERADAIVMLAESCAAGDDEAAAYWRTEIARLSWALEG